MSVLKLKDGTGAYIPVVTGPPGAPGPAGPPGTAYLNAQWNFNQNTAVSPNSGTMRMNATTYAATTLLWVSETDRDGLDRNAGLNAAQVGDQIIMQSAQGRAVWQIDGQADSGAYRTFTVTLVESSGSRPSASSPTTLYFASVGSEVSALDDLTDVNAPTPADGDALVWDAGTSKWVPGAVATGGTGGEEPIGVTGGAVTDVGDYRVHTFTSSGTFTTSGTLPVEVLVVAGGGGGGATRDGNWGGAGGGGAGGLILGSTSVPAGTHTVTIGAGGAGAPDYGSIGSVGGNSVFTSMTAVGGGGGGDSGGLLTPSGGGSGGGGGLGGAGGASTSGQGYKGGDSANANPYGGAGGGGSAGPGVNTSTVGNQGSNGGPGTSNGWLTLAATYAAGGGGGNNGAGAVGTGGSAEAGSGVNNANGTSATGYGNGGGGGSGPNGNSGGSGSGGIVLVRYLIADLAATTPTYLEAGDLIEGAGIDLDTTTTPGAVIISSTGGGSTILSGTATPVSDTGAVGDYYLDTDDRILYGPKGTAATDEYVIPPGPFDTLIGGGTSLGQNFRFTVGGLVTAVRVWVPSGASATTGYKVYVWAKSGELLGSQNAGTLTLNAWNTVTLTSPLSVAAATTYVVAVWVPTGPAQNLGVVTGTHAGQTSGNVLSIADGVDGKALNFGTVVDTIPATSYAGKAYFGVSPVFVVSIPWPVALKSVPPGGTAAQVLAKSSATDYAVAWAAGSTILSGTATPTEATGNGGDYYLDTDDRVLYGPKAEPSSPGPAQYVTPAVGSLNNANTTAGMKFQFDTAGVVTGIRVQVFTVGDPTWEAYLFSAGGTMLASKDFTAAVGWNDVIFDTPVSVVPATIYVAAFWQPTNGYSGGQFVAYPGQISGNVTGIAGSATYAATRDIFPGTASAAAWGVSPIFRVTAPSWPVALKSIPPGGTTAQVLNKTSATDYAVAWAAGTYWGMWSGTQAAYDAIGTKDDNTLYVVI